MNFNRKIALFVIIVISIAVALSGFYLLLFKQGSLEEITELSWQRTGGVIGLNEEFSVYSNGSSLYTSNQFGTVKQVLTEVELKNLLSLVKKASFTLGKSFVAKPNVSDYFNFRLTVNTASSIRTVEWVEDWASEKKLPSELIDVQLYVQSIIEKNGARLLTLMLITDKVEYLSGEEVLATIKLINFGGKTLELELPLIYPDLIVLNNEEVIYQRSKHFIPPPMTRKITLETAGEEIWTFTWGIVDDQGKILPPNKYTMKGQLTVDIENTTFMLNTKTQTVLVN